ncbi:hypothetical protein DGMP_21220 [Desulfomarina profundi]|uniref:Zinc resistance protein n=1 Tax=Desulfomarina profundi TaxID=2772557 RepID=A0A8D5JHG6_9BACT|nr:hypothetical protein [Desulfomarina profundi]BCL61429.1 hypothetical protein DGMP_21220 [Desulfomarina profundi]
MKRTLIAAVATGALLLGIAATNASAWNYGSPWMGVGYGMTNVGYNNGNNSQFQADTRDLRLKIAQARVELNALVATPGYDTEKVNALARDIAANQLALEQTAQKYGYGVASYNMMGGPGMMMGPGMMNGGYGYGCW